MISTSQRSLRITSCCFTRRASSLTVHPRRYSRVNGFKMSSESHRLSSRATQACISFLELARLCTKSGKSDLFLCGLCVSLRLSAFERPINAENAEIRRGPQRKDFHPNSIFCAKPAPYIEFDKLSSGLLLHCLGSITGIYSNL